MTTAIPPTNHPDVVLVGAGIMSATLAVILKELDPSLKIEIYEVLGSEAQESSNAWNNAGTGHAALCELNYTPQESDGSIDISKALLVNTEFDISRQFWAYLVKKGAIKDPQSFIHPVPHFSFVRGSENVAFLRNASRRSLPIIFTMGWNIPMTRSRWRRGSRWSWKAVIQASRLRRHECVPVRTWIMAPSPRIFSIPYAVRKDSQSTFSTGCKVCAVMETYGI